MRPKAQNPLLGSVEECIYCKCPNYGPRDVGLNLRLLFQKIALWSSSDPGPTWQDLAPTRYYSSYDNVEMSEGHQLLID